MENYLGNIQFSDCCPGGRAVVLRAFEMNETLLVFDDLVCSRSGETFVSTSTSTPSRTLARDFYHFGKWQLHELILWKLQYFPSTFHKS